MSFRKISPLIEPIERDFLQNFGGDFFFQGKRGDFSTYRYTGSANRDLTVAITVWHVHYLPGTCALFAMASDAY